VNFAKVTLDIQQVIGLVQLGLTTVQAIRTHIADGRVSVQQELTADEVVSRVSDAQAAALALGDAAAADVAAQHAGDQAKG
jgi:hypothetical protein